MIELTLSQFFVGALILAFIGAGVSFFADRRRHRRRARAIQGRSIRCRVCGRVYPHHGMAGPEDCPDCGRGNLRGRDRRLG